ncbi:hypothetical protein FACS1894187_08010 [Synergistales bacterium]|nr:hypothetical protein FACS1894187_08010 [Synergistales bacterium]
MKAGNLGVYVYPEAVVSAPDYAKRLVWEAGVDYFILRAGYGLDFPASVGQAVEVVRGLKVGVCVMMGSWWGRGNIKPLENLPSKSYESRYPMAMPGSAIDAEIAAKYEKACKQFRPDSVCLTHGRFRHPAYLDGIFDEGSEDQEYLARMEAAGIPRAEMLAARSSWEQAMGKTDKETLLKYAENGMIEFLCELSQSDAFKRLVAFRCDTIHRSLRKLRQAVVSCGVSFGSNAYSPTAAAVCGQDYDDSYSEICDFVQPLFPYMEYHHYEPIAAWGRYLLQNARLDEPTAIEAAKRLFYLGGAVCPDSFSELDTCGEGEGGSIRSIVGKELKMCVPYLTKPYKTQPVLRGVQWDKAATDDLIEEAKDLGFNSLIFMGCEYLLKGPSPSADWF